MLGLGSGLGLAADHDEGERGVHLGDGLEHAHRLYGSVRSARSARSARSVRSVRNIVASVRVLVLYECYRTSVIALK